MSAFPAHCSRRPSRLLALLVVLAFAVGTGACSSAGGSLTVTGAWVRATVTADQTTAAYFSVKNGTSTSDALLSVSSPIAGMAQVHETTMASGMMGMQEVSRVDVPAGGTVQFAPGGYHVMLMNLTGTLAAGTTIDLTLTFEHAGKVVVKAEVRTS